MIKEKLFNTLDVEIIIKMSVRSNWNFSNCVDSLRSKKTTLLIFLSIIFKGKPLEKKPFQDIQHKWNLNLNP